MRTNIYPCDYSSNIALVQSRDLLVIIPLKQKEKHFSISSAIPYLHSCVVISSYEFFSQLVELLTKSLLFFNSEIIVKIYNFKHKSNVFLVVPLYPHFQRNFTTPFFTIVAMRLGIGHDYLHAIYNSTIKTTLQFEVTHIRSKQLKSALHHKK